MTRLRDNRIPAKSAALRAIEFTLLMVCLGILALRVTYTEGPVAQTFIMPTLVADTVYSLTLSALLAFALVFWLLWGTRYGRPAYRLTGMEIGAAVFAAAALISTVGASDVRTALTQTVVLLGPVLAALLLAQLLDSPSRIRLVLVVIVALGIVSTYQSAEQFLVSNAILIEQYEKAPEMLLEPLGIEAGTFHHFLFEHRLYGRGIRGFFTTGNSAASFAIFAIFAAIALLIERLQAVRDRKVEPRYALFVVVALVVLVAGLFMNRSKGGTLSFFVGLASFGLLLGIDQRFSAYRRHIFRALLPSLLLLAVIAGILATMYGIKHGRLPGGNSMLVRWQYWEASAQMYADHPVAGVGPGNFSEHYPRYKPAPALESVADPHNWPLSLITQFGPLGLLGFLAMVLLPLQRLLTSSQTDMQVGKADCQSPGSKGIGGGLLVLSLCLLLIRSLLIPMSGVNDPDVWLYEVITLFVAPAAAFLIGFLLVATPLKQAPSRESSLARAGLFAALVSAVLAVLLHNLVDFALFEPGIWMTFWIVLACLVAAGRGQQPDPKPAPAWPPKLRWATGGIAVVLLVAFVHAIWLPAHGMTVGIERAQRAASFGNFDLAHQALEAAARADRRSAVPVAFNGRLYLQRSEQTAQGSARLLDDAARCLQEAIARNPADYKNYERMAIVHAQRGDFQEAYDWYLKTTGLYPGLDRLWFELGQLAERLGKRDAARDHYAMAVEIEDSYRGQFRQMYPERNEVVSRLGQERYQLAKLRIEELSR